LTVNLSLDYRAAVLAAPRDVRIQRLRMKGVEDDEVVVKVSCCTLCPTDVRKYLGFTDLPGPLILGHEISGTIAHLGRKVERFMEGDSVTVMSIIPCGYCRYCVLGMPELCDHLVGLGGSAGPLERYLALFEERGWGGGLAEYIKVPQKIVVKLMKGVSAKNASLIEPFANVLKGQQVCDPSPTQVEVIFGGGPIGILHLIAAKALGVNKVILVEPYQDRRRIALEYGASHVIDPEEEDPVQRVQELTDGVGADIVIVATGWRAEAKCTELAVELAAKGGRVNIFAATHPQTMLHIDPNLIHYKELKILGSFEHHPIHYYEAMELISSKNIDFERIVYPRVPLERVAEAFELYGKPGSMKVAVEP
jgi:L-iditol 2-dehydrogenase